MGSKLIALAKTCDDLNKDLVNWGGRVKAGQDSLKNQAEYVEAGLDMVYHEASDLCKHYKLNPSKQKLEALSPKPAEVKSVLKGVKAVNNAAKRLSTESGKFWKEIPMLGKNIVKRCETFDKMIVVISNDKLARGKKLDVLFPALQKAVAKVKADVQQILDNSVDVIKPEAATIKDSLKLSMKTTVANLGKMTGTAQNEVRKGEKAFNKNNSRLSRVKQAKLDAAAKLIKKISIDIDL